VKVSHAWLRSLCKGLESSPVAVAERLTGAGLEVDGIVEYGAASRDVVIAEVRRVERHPKRDKLTLVTVAHGDGESTVVCGAPNVPPPGGRVVLARLGATLPAAGMTVTERDIGGFVSAGMLCSETELGLAGGGGKGDGIVVLDDVAAKLGTSLAEALPASHDTIFELSVTANRPDALGHVGVARELAACLRLPFEPPVADAPARVASGLKLFELVSVAVEDRERCPRYGAALVVDVEVAPSPRWLRYRLESLGVRPVNNVVDVTNLVLLEYGQPIHAFDLDRLPGGRVVVRRARPGETIVTIDHVTRRLDPDDLLITDGTAPIALAGVMGGADSEIGPAARRVLIECAYFAPRGIRRTSRRHGLHSEASHRFERGCDPGAVPDVLAHTASLMTRLCGAKAVPEVILEGAPPSAPPPIRLRLERIARLLGVAVDPDEARDILERLGCAVTPRDGALDVVTPSHRPDLSIEEDLVEEVMRVWGIERVPTRTRALSPAPGRSAATVDDRARRAACELGLSEALTFGFVAPAELAALSAPVAAVVLKNPLGEDRGVMRTTVLPGLLSALGRARRHGVRDVRLFAVGHAFLAPQGDEVLPREERRLGAVLAGTRGAGIEARALVDVYDAKGFALELIERVTGRAARIERADARAVPHLHPRAAAQLFLGDRLVGSLGTIHPDVDRAFELEGSCQVVELTLDALEAAAPRRAQFQPIPVLPPVMRDLALVLPDEVAAGDVEAAIREAAGDLCESVELFDVYSGKGVPAAHRSLAFHLVFRDPKAAREPERARSLTDQEVDERTSAVVAAVGKRYGAVVRGAA
jgi:phenylalanyl-tRNA synthetase beta chain